MENSILNMTHEELMASSADVRLQYKEAKRNQFFDSVRVVIENGYTHIQLWGVCIKVKSNEHGVYYIMKSGIGTGNDLAKSSDLRFITDEVASCGFGEIKSYK